MPWCVSKHLKHSLKYVLCACVIFKLSKNIQFVKDHYWYLYVEVCIPTSKYIQLDGSNYRESTTG